MSKQELCSYKMGGDKSKIAVQSGSELPGELEIATVSIHGKQCEQLYQRSNCWELSMAAKIVVKPNR